VDGRGIDGKVFGGLLAVGGAHSLLSIGEKPAQLARSRLGM
jgi:hypothetical protein